MTSAPGLRLAALAGLCLACVRTIELPPPRAPAPEPEGISVRETIAARVLPSGLRIILDADAHSRLAIVASAVHAGASAEPRGKGGLAHLVEHLTFRARGEHDPRTLWQRLTRLPLSAQVFGATAWDQMAFRSMAPAAAWRELVALEAGRLATPLAGIDARAVELERRITEDQSHMSDDSGEAQSWGDLLADDPGAADAAVESAAGTAASRRSLTLEDARAFARARFQPSEMTFVVAGNVGGATLDDVVALLPRALVDAPADVHEAPAESASPPPNVREPADPVPARAEGIAVVAVPSLPRPALYLTWHLPSVMSADSAGVRWVTRLVANQLDAGLLRRRDPRVVAVGVGRRDTLRASLLVVKVELREATSPKAVAGLVAERVMALARTPESARGVFEQQRRREVADLRLGGAPPAGRALNEALVSNARRQIVSTLRDVADFANERWPRVAALASATLGAAPHVVLRVPAPLPPTAARAETTREESDDGWLSQAATWDSSALRALIEPLGAANVTRATLVNGTTLLFLRRPGTRAAAWLGFRGGTGSGASPALALWATGHRLDVRGEATRLDLLAGDGIDTDTTYDTVSFRPEQTGSALALLVARARGGLAWWPTPVDFERTLDVAPSDDAPGLRANRIFWSNLFPLHPYGHVYTLADARRLTRAQAAAWLDAVVRPANAVFVVVGDLDADALLAAANRATDGWLPRAVTGLGPPPPPIIRLASAGPRTAVVDHAGLRMVDLRLGCLLPTGAARDRAHHWVLARAVEERLFNDLRQATGATQGVSVRDNDLLGAADLTISVSIEPTRLGDVLGALHRVWSRWGTTGFDAGETNLGKWRAIGALASHFETQHQIARSVFNQWNQGLPIEELDALPEQIIATTAAELTAAFAVCRANTVMTLLGDRATIEPALGASWPDVEPPL